MSKPGVYNIADHYKGDTFDGVQFTIINSTDSLPINITGCLIKIQFKKNSNNGSIIKEITEISGITIIDAINGVFKINPFLIDWDEGRYLYDVQITFPDLSVRTYIKGTILIIQDTTS